MKKGVTQKDVRIAQKVLSPKAVSVLRLYRTRSKAMRRHAEPEKKIETVTVKVATFPCFSSCDRVYEKVTLPRLKCLEIVE